MATALLSPKLIKTFAYLLKYRKVDVIIRGLTFFLSCFLLAASLAAEDKPSYSWIVEEGRVIGCLESAKISPNRDAECSELPFASLNCASFEKNEVIKDLALCRTKLEARAYWIGIQANVCGEFIEYGEKPKIERVFFRQVKADECPHKWVNVDTACNVTEGGDFLFHPGSNFRLSDLIPEIMNLKEQEAIPPGVFKKYDSKRIAITLNYKIFREREEKKVKQVRGKESYDYLNDSEIQLVFSEKNLDSIAERGFLNQHQTKTTSPRAALLPIARARTEDKMLNLKIEKNNESEITDLANKLRPKYAYFGQQRIAAEKSPMHNMNLDYGNIAAVFMEKVKDRTTFTMMDSLNQANKKNTYTPRFKENHILPGDQYVEAQIWGELTMNDVNYFIVNCPNFSPASEVAINKLKALGKAVYSCKVDTVTLRGEPLVVRIDRDQAL